MKKQKTEQRVAPAGIMLLAKKAGITSFSSLWSIKNALNTGKVGHTGTLDSFADGLLVVLSGSLTHIVPHITGFTKTYKAVVCFGKETDTLDPTGQIVCEGSAPSKEEIEKILPQFTGALLQLPPAFSALHVDGKRASDLIRAGKEVHLEPRQIFVYSNKLSDYKAPSQDDPCSYAILEITCSKGTYIRALARDIAQKLGTCAHLSALRRTQVGPFKLEDAACYSELEEFTIENALCEKTKKRNEGLKNLVRGNERDCEEKIRDIKNHFMVISPELASVCGFEIDILKKESEKSYLNGRPLSSRMFNRVSIEHSADSREIAVFYEDRSFAGMIKLNEDNRLNYSFVVHPEKNKFEVFTWNEILNGDFPVQYMKKGTALTVGSFEAVHIGHAELIKSTVEKKDFISGVVTFSSSIKKNSKEIFQLKDRLSYFKELGARFAIVIDFDEKFASCSGREFFEILKNQCGLKFLAEGKDFKCGSKGSCSMEEIKKLSCEFDFEIKEFDFVSIDGIKVSSSRIKEKIQNGLFSGLKEMLGRFYSLNFENCHWKEKSTGKEMSIFETDAKSEIILPKDGIYKIAARFADDTILHTDLQVEKNKISVFLPTMNYANSLASAAFL